MRSLRREKSSKSSRSGALTVEFALVVPLLFMLLFAQLEFARANMIRNAIKTACYEGARAGVVPGVTAEEVRAAAQAILNSTAINTSVITVTPDVITDQTTSITVTIDIPIAENSWVVPRYFIDQTFTNSVTLARERMDLVVF